MTSHITSQTIAYEYLTFEDSPDTDMKSKLSFRLKKWKIGKWKYAHDFSIMIHHIFFLLYGMNKPLRICMDIFEPGLGHDFMKWFDDQYNIECHVKNIRHVHPRNVHKVWMLNAT